MGKSSSRPEEDKNVTELLKEEASCQTEEDLCDTHREGLKLFCVDHQKPICVICRDAKDHKKHQCVPINEAAADSKVRHCFEFQLTPPINSIIDF